MLKKSDTCVGGHDDPQGGTGVERRATIRELGNKKIAYEYYDYHLAHKATLKEMKKKMNMI